MKKIIFIISIIGFLVISIKAYTNPPCPKFVDKLEDLAYCTVSYDNNKSRALANTGTSPYMDPSAAALLNSMSQVYAAPQVNPAIASVSLASNMAVALGSYHRYGYFPYPYSYPGIWVNIPIYH
ncbi:MAG: hypothetical protein COS89_00310 [Deltaproteobacteria bacterium CG07_land_8_20_14_0_80_38_7]|nr:MAG: hypothetical protein COS89_00310 [Deltaproteobacteria bacterium CG07_land_8_20_14_0_80_38_7]